MRAAPPLPYEEPMTRTATAVAILLIVVTSLVGTHPACAAMGAANTATKNAPTAAAASAKQKNFAKFTAQSDTVETDADLSWNVMFEILNQADTGLYLDSLRCEVDDLDEGKTDAPRHTSLDLTRLVRLSPTISAQGSNSINSIQHSGPALAERARLTYRLFCHRIDGSSITLETVVQVVPGTSKEYVSQFLDVDGQKIEYVLFPARGGVVSPPGVLLVHGAGGNARRMLRTARTMASRGYTVALVSMPGFGSSSGSKDLMGPASVTAASKVLDVLAKTEGIDATKLAAWGVSRGATVVAELAARRTDLKAVVLQSGIYDLWAVYRGTQLAGFRETIVAEAGEDSAAWRERSPLLRAMKITAPVFVIHGEKDTHIPVAQAHALVAALEARGAKVESSFAARGEQTLGPNDGLRVGLAFLKRIFEP